MKKVLITDSVDKRSVEILKTGGCEVTYQPGMQPAEIKKIIGEYEGLIVRSDTQVTSELIELASNMEVIGRAGTGTDNIDSDAATRKGIIVMNTPGGNTISTAEHTIALIMSLCRNIPQSNQSLREGKWERKKYKGTELHSKTIGIIGLGKIGREVASRCKAFGMEVIGYDPVLSSEAASSINLELTTLDELFSKSDFISVHVPLTDETRDLISKQTLAKCRDGVRVINCARGGIVNETDLIEALNSGKAAGAAFDVYLQEPPDFNSPLFTHPKIVCTPHLGASTEEAQGKVAVQIAEQILDYFNGREIKGAINASAIQSSGNKEIKPYEKLSESLGCLAAQMIKGQLNSVKINLYGPFLHSFETLITASVLKGFLSKQMTGAVNLINAPFLAEEMGLKISQTKSASPQAYNNLLHVEFESSGGKYSLSGTVFGNNEPRIVSMDQYYLELKPEGLMIIYKNIDKPGMLAAVSKVLAEAKINIAGLSLGRIEQGKDALTVINIDSEIDQKTLNLISSMNGIHDVLAVKL